MIVVGASLAHLHTQMRPVSGGLQPQGSWLLLTWLFTRASYLALATC